MSAYYNEFDNKAADWLEKLMEEGLIPEGVVDRRDIRDIDPEEIKGYTQYHFFAGIGGWPLALRMAGWPDDVPVFTGSPPCQPFSLAGKGLGKKDERHLAPVWLKLVQSLEPQHVMGEQVASATKKDEWLDDLIDELEAVGYDAGAVVVPACAVGAPHIRQRLWFFGAKDSDYVLTPCEIKTPWEDSDLLYCKDNKWRPVEAGEFPMKDRSDIHNRVSRLRGYGNAIVPQVASEMIVSYMKALGMKDERTLREKITQDMKEKLPKKLMSGIYNMRWEDKKTPRGRDFSQIIASNKRSRKDNKEASHFLKDFITNWAACVANETTEALLDKAELSGWATCMMNDLTGSKYCYAGGDKNKIVFKLPGQVELTGWATARASDFKGDRTASSAESEIERTGSVSTSLPVNVHVSGWGTPNCMDHMKSANLEQRRKNGGCSNLKDQIEEINAAEELQGWMTPQAFDANGHPRMPRPKRDGNRDMTRSGSYRWDLKDQTVLTLNDGIHIAEIVFENVAGFVAPKYSDECDCDNNGNENISGWATATTRDYKDGCECDVPVNSLLGREVWGTGWRTPSATDGEGGEYNLMEEREGNPKVKLRDQGLLGGWSAPQADDNAEERKIEPDSHQKYLCKDILEFLHSLVEHSKNKEGDGMVEVRLSEGKLIFKLHDIQSGRLNPAHSRWLMGYPKEWDEVLEKEDGVSG